ncbi:MAG: leucine-rich repeat domain-containing protein [Lachnospiraceae bacterium]|nr:leucine-rich repeat domain-containing protein [Lachnospiraceae bacterium]
MDKTKLLISKKAIAVTLAGVTLAATIPATPLPAKLESLTVVNALENETSAGSFSYSQLTDGTVEITKFIGSETKVVIPSKISGKTVSGIGTHAFYGNEDVTSVTIPNGVTYIGKEAFSDCTGMTEVNISDSVTSIEESAFQGCKALKTINIGSGLTTIKSRAFEGCLEVESITLPETVTYIGAKAFYNCQYLLYFNVPDGIRYIGSAAFDMDTSDAEKGIPWYSLKKGEVYFGNIYYAYKGTMPENTTITIKDGTTTIGDSAFSGMTNLVKVDMPDTVVNIGQRAFYNCIGLKEIDFSNSIVELPNNVFRGCSGLTDLTLPDSIKTIRDYAFRDCTGLTYINIPQKANYIAQSAFQKCSNLKYVVFPENCDFDSLGKYNNELIEKTFLDNNYLSSTQETPSSIKYLVITKKDNGTGITKQPFEGNYEGEFLIQKGISYPDSMSASSYPFELLEDGSKYAVSGVSEMKLGNLPDPLVINGKSYMRTKTLSVLEGFEYVAPTCQSEGMKAVWVSDDSTEYYLDEFGTVPYDFINDMMIGFPERIIPIVDHHYVDGACEWCGKELNTVSYEGSSITLDGDIIVNYFMQLDESVLKDENAVMRFTTESGNVTEVKVKDAKIDTTTVAGKSCYVFSCNMPAKEMNDTISGQIILSDGSVSKAFSCTVKQYADAIIKNTENKEAYTKAKDVITSMLVYGSYAQIYFEHNTDKLAFELSGSSEKEEVEAVSAGDLIKYSESSLTVENTDNVTLAGTNLSLLSNTTLRLFFKVKDGSTPKFLYDSNELTVHKMSGYSYIEITGIKAHQLNTTFTITVVDGSVSKSVQYNPMTYGYNVLSRAESEVRTPELKNLMKAMYIYNAKAIDYNK